MSTPRPKAPAPAALLFDVDGTLADTEETHRLAFNAAFAALGLPYAWDPPSYEDLLQIAGGKERLRAFFQSLPLPSAERERLSTLAPDLHRVKTERYTALVAAGAAPLRPGVLRLLDEAAAHGVPIGIATTTTPDNVLALLHAALGPDGPQRFAVIACGDVVPRKKPAPDIYQYALAALGAPAAQVVAFEDSHIGLRAAQAADLFTVVTPTRWTHAQDLRSAELLLPHLGDPDHSLPADAAARAGGPMLTLSALARLRAVPPMTKTPSGAH